MTKDADYQVVWPYLQAICSCKISLCTQRSFEVNVVRCVSRCSEIVNLSVIMSNGSFRIGNLPSFSIKENLKGISTTEAAYQEYLSNINQKTYIINCIAGRATTVGSAEAEAVRTTKWVCFLQVEFS